MPPRPTTAHARPGLAHVVERNISALLARRHREEAGRGRQDRIAGRISQFAGSMRFVYIHLVIVGTWIVWNVGWLPFRPFDPQFTVLGMTAAVEAIFLSTFVLITQNRMQESADTRADLDLQVSLLDEHEVTRLVHLTMAIAKQMEIAEAHDPELEELARDVHPEKVLDEISASTRRFDLADGPPDGVSDRSLTY
jgi:uncharacterized membrane protein